VGGSDQDQTRPWPAPGAGGAGETTIPTKFKIALAIALFRQPVYRPLTYACYFFLREISRVLGKWKTTSDLGRMKEDEACGADLGCACARKRKQSLG
jgi:hypothetical protein